MAAKGPTELAMSLAPWLQESQMAVKICTYLNDSSVLAPNFSAPSWIAVTVASSSMRFTSSLIALKKPFFLPASLSSGAVSAPAG